MSTVQPPTFRNIVLKHKGLKGFFEEHQADAICLQVGWVCVLDLWPLSFHNVGCGYCECSV